MDERDNEKLNSSEPSGGMDEFTLESILAEYKGSAYIDGDRRTPQDKLEEETRRIVREETQKLPKVEVPEPPREKPPVSIKNAYERQYEPPRDPDEPPPEPVQRKPGDVRIKAYSDMSETEQEFFGIGKYARPSAVPENADEAETVIEKETKREERAKKRPAILRRRAAEKPPEPEEKPEEEPEPPELTLRQMGAAYVRSVKPLKRRGAISLVISLVMVYMSWAFAGKLWIPAVFRTEPRVFALTVLILLLAVMFMGRDVLARGLADLFKLRSGAETLVSAACIASAADAVFMAAGGADGLGAPFCAVAAFSMACAILGTHFTYSGVKRSCKAAIASSEPYIVTPEHDRVKDGMVLVKTQRGPEGFTARLDEEDGAAHAYAFAAPLLMIASLALSLLAGIKGGMDAFFHDLAAMTAVSASFSALICFGLPFASASKQLSKVGAAIAGWSGACDIRDSIGVVITDSDVFPAGTMSLGGVRVFAGVGLHKVLAYTGSVIMASGSGLSPLFTELLRQQACSTAPVSDFSCYEGGGVGASVRGERVLVGSSGFMNLMGVRLPQSLDVKTAVYSAINNELVGVFAVDYKPVNSVQHALVTILRTKILPLLAVRDFNMTPMMIQQKFKITTDKLDYLTVDARYKLSDEGETGTARPVAMLCREGLGPLAETIAAGRQLRSTVRLNVLLTLLGTAAGLLLTFYLCWIRAFDSASAINMFTYMLAWLAAVLLVSGTAKRY